MQKIIKILILSIVAIPAFGQSYVTSYSPERLELIERFFNNECNGTEIYCDCIISGVTSSIPFNKLRDSESVYQINSIIRDCQEKHKNFPYDPSMPAEISVSSYVTFNERSDSTIFEKDTLYLHYSVVNNGIGIAYVPSLIVNIDGPQENNINYSKRIEFRDLAPLDREEGVLQIIPETISQSDTLSISNEVLEGNNWPSNKEIINLWSVASDNDNKSVFFKAKKTFDGKRYTVEFSYKNIGSAPLRFPKIKFELQEGAIVTNSPWISKLNEAFKFEFNASNYPISGRSVAAVIYPGEVIHGDFQFTIKPGYDKNSMKLSSDFEESEGWKYLDATDIEVNNTRSTQLVNVQQVSSSQSTYITRVEVDKVPISSDPKENHYAVIIGNEKYTNSGVVDNVDGAEYDAEIFKKYSTNILSVPADHIEYAINASAAQMRDAIDRIIKRARQTTSPVVYFYYAGHGWPEQDTDQPLLIPADIGPSQIELALNLNDIMGLFREDDDLELLAFIDACYASEKFSENTRSFKRTVNSPLVRGKQILFSAVSVKQEANTHAESGHGVFTYYLLNALKQNKKNITVDQLSMILRQDVTEYVTNRGQKTQLPSVHIAAEIKSQSNKWPIIK